jgi:hypothetical protein
MNYIENLLNQADQLGAVSLYGCCARLYTAEYVKDHIDKAPYWLIEPYSKELIPIHTPEDLAKHIPPYIDITKET